MRTLLVDNHDSYTYNLFHLLAAACGRPPVVLTNDAPELGGLDLSAFDAVVVSPGPGRPQVSRDLGACLDVLRATDLPVLGVCLGHQALGWLAGAEVVPAPTPRHGHLEHVRHCGQGLFAGLPQRFTAVRYHSLCVAPPLPGRLEALAWAADGVLMALRDRERPWWGVQFHPESIATEHGRRLLENFRDLVAGGASAGGASADRPGRRRPAVRATAGGTSAAGAAASPVAARRERASGWAVRCERLDGEVDTARTFATLFGHQDCAFWLDSSRAEPGLARFSFLGDAGGPHGEVLAYRAGTGAVEVRRETGEPELVSGSIFDVLEQRLRERRLEPCPELPFDLTSGYVGYFGYELKAECGSPNRHRAATPDAVWMAATRMVAVDHETASTWLVALCAPGDVRAAAEAERWLAVTGSLLRGMLRDGRAGVPGPGPEVGGIDVEARLARPRAAYLDDIAACQAQLRAGESYEICLTNTAELPFDGDPLDAYLRLRRRNPAPYAAYLALAGTHVLCSSPERFLKVAPDRTVESKPIKGTRPRHADGRLDAGLRQELERSAKDRAENLMITDLVRNDLGRVCEVGSVTVPRLMAVESYQTVHQLVSTVRGRLREGVGPVAAARACFPGGSMTGAPKLRTMEIIDRLETRARGIYSGTIGFFGLSGGADLNVVIRTAVLHDGTVAVGTGGAIVLDSRPDEEFEELLLKAQAPLGAIAEAAARSASAHAR